MSDYRDLVAVALTLAWAAAMLVVGLLYLNLHDAVPRPVQDMGSPPAPIASTDRQGSVQNAAETAHAAKRRGTPSRS